MSKEEVALWCAWFRDDDPEYPADLRTALICRTVARSAGIDAQIADYMPGETIIGDESDFELAAAAYAATQQDDD